MANIDFNQLLHRLALGTTVTFGTIANVGTLAVAVGSDTSQLVELFIQSDPDNTGDVLVGDTASQTVELAPGESVTVPALEMTAVEAKAEGADTNITLNFAGVEAN